MGASHQYATLPPEPEKATLEGKNKFLAFWFFLGAECVLFATLFGTFLGLRHETNGGPTGAELFEFSLVFIATVLLLTSSLTSVLAIQDMHRNNLKGVQIWFIVTIILGAGFLGLEIYEFDHYVHEGLGLSTSAFASSFYMLVGTHGTHVLLGILWIGVLVIQSFKKGITVVTAPKFYVAAIYWHFVDLVWIFIFTVVYLLGKVG